MAADSFSDIRADAAAQLRALARRPLQTSARLLLAAAGLYCGFYGFHAGGLLDDLGGYNWTYLHSFASVVYWALGMAFFTLAFFPSLDQVRSVLQARHLPEALGVVFVLLLAVAFRLPSLTEYPPDVHGDEALCGNQAVFLQRDAEADPPLWKMFEFGHHMKPNFTYYLTNVFLQTFGENLFGLRMSSVFMGVGVVFFLYLMGRLQWSPWMGLLAAALAVPWHPFVHFSRDGLNNIQATFFLAASMTCLYWGIERRRYGPMVLAGIFGGLGMQTYQAAYIWPFLVAGYFLHSHVRNPWFSLRHSGRLVLFLVGIVLAMGMLTAIHARGFATRGGEVTILNIDQINAHRGIYNTNTFTGVLAGQFQTTWKVFTDENPGTRDTQHRVKFAYIDPACYGLMLLGLGLSLVLIWQTRWFMLLWWFFLALFLGNVLTIEVPWSPRLVAIFVPIPLLCAGVFEVFRRPLARLPEALGLWLLAIPVLAVLFFSYSWNEEKYFEQYPRERPAGSWTIVSHYLNDLPEAAFAYWLGPPHIYFRYDTLQFLARDTDGINIYNPEEAFPFEVTHRPNRDAFIFVFISNQNFTPLIEAFWPGAEREVVPNDYGGPSFFVYRIPREEIAGRVVELDGHWLEATVYNNRDFRGPGMKEMHRILSYSGGHVYQHHSPHGQFSVEWRGFLDVDKPGSYGFNFWLPHAGNASLTIDGRPVIPEGGRDGEITLQPGRHALSARYRPTEEIGRAALLWRRPGETYQLITPEYLLPPDAPVEQP